jgi:multidrug transporter EmrE-like cation transporter
MHWLFLILAIGGNVIANVALKKLAISDINIVGWSGVVAVLTSLWFWLAGLGSVTLLSGYLLSIRKVELGFAYAAITSGALILIGQPVAGIFRAQLVYKRQLHSANRHKSRDERPSTRLYL